MLYKGSDDATSLQEKPIWTPVKVQLAQFSGNVVVLSHHHSVEDGQSRLLIHPIVASEEAIAINCAAISILLRDWKQRKQVRWTQRVLTPPGLVNNETFRSLT